MNLRDTSSRSGNLLQLHCSKYPDTFYRHQEVCRYVALLLQPFSDPFLILIELVSSLYFNPRSLCYPVSAGAAKSFSMAS